MVTFTVGEAAELLGVSADTVRRWVDSGQLPAARTSGGRRKVNGAALAKFAAKRAATPSALPIAESARYHFAGSNALRTQITQGAPADVFASADTANMQKIVSAGLVETPVTFARNKLQIAVAPGNPKGITGLADLAKAGMTVVLEAQGVP